MRGRLISPAHTIKVLHGYCSNTISNLRLCVAIEVHTQAQCTCSHGMSLANPLQNTPYTQTPYITFNIYCVCRTTVRVSPHTDVGVVLGKLLSWKTFCNALKRNSLLHNLSLRFYLLKILPFKTVMPVLTLIETCLGKIDRDYK